MIKPVDTHIHLDNSAFDEDRDEIFKKIGEDLEFAINIGYNYESSEKSIEYAQKYPFIYATVGYHPEDIGEYDKDKLIKLAENPKVVAIGEIGLDYHWMSFDKTTQEKIFRSQLDVARELKLPIVIHSREAMGDTLRILEDYPDIKGIFHCYPGSYETAKMVVDRFYLGIGGVLTFKNAKKLVEVVKDIPLERLVLETDCPYMTPVPFRGKRNIPLYVKYVAEKIAEIKDISYDEVVKITTENAKKVYGI